MEYVGAICAIFAYVQYVQDVARCANLAIWCNVVHVCMLFLSRAGDRRSRHLPPHRMSDTNEHSEVVTHVEDLSHDLQHLDLQGAEVDPDETKLEEPQQIRCLIENNQVGGIIGKAGANVKKVREETNVFLSILKAESPSVKERIMVLKGSVLQISQALRMIADLLIEAASQREQSTEHGASIKLLVHRYTVGAIIGKGGAVIKQTQQDTGTTYALIVRTRMRDASACAWYSARTCPGAVVLRSNPVFVCVQRQRFRFHRSLWRSPLRNRCVRTRESTQAKITHKQNQKSM